MPNGWDVAYKWDEVRLHSVASTISSRILDREQQWVTPLLFSALMSELLQAQGMFRDYWHEREWCAGLLRITSGVWSSSCKRFCQILFNAEWSLAELDFERVPSRNYGRHCRHARRRVPRSLVESNQQVYLNHNCRLIFGWFTSYRCINEFSDLIHFLVFPLFRSIATIYKQPWLPVKPSATTWRPASRVSRRESWLWIRIEVRVSVMLVFLSSWP